jgi:glycerol-3-phosphate acyltransferase PlsY
VFGLDMFKGLGPSLLAGWVLMPGVVADGPSESIRNLCRLIVGAFAVVGHNYPVYIGFRGGKGVSTSFGVAVGVWPELTVAAVLSFLTWAAGLGLTRMSSVGSLSGAVLFPVYVAAATAWSGASLAARWPFMVFAVAVAGLVVARHRANIARILSGTETRVVSGSGGEAHAPHR